MLSATAQVPGSAKCKWSDIKENFYLITWGTNRWILSEVHGMYVCIFVKIILLLCCFFSRTNIGVFNSKNMLFLWTKKIIYRIYRMLICHIVIHLWSHNILSKWIWTFLIWISQIMLLHGFLKISFVYFISNLKTNVIIIYVSISVVHTMECSWKACHTPTSIWFSLTWPTLIFHLFRVPISFIGTCFTDLS